MTDAAEPTLRVLVFAEDVLGMTLAHDLCDRVLVERGPTWWRDNWGSPDLRASLRAWSGLEPAAPWTYWSSLSARTRGNRASHGLGIKGYGLFAYKAARLAASLERAPTLVVLCLDTDGNDDVREEMLGGLEKARVEHLPFVLAVAHQESEAWVVAGFVPEHNRETELVRSLLAELRFDPTLEPHRLLANSSTDPHDAKRFCKRLFGELPPSPRTERCWLETPLEVLEQRGASTGLPDYLHDVARIVLPLLGA